MPSVDVDGVGLVGLEVPPVGVRYQFKTQSADFVAVSGKAVSFWQ